MSEAFYTVEHAAERLKLHPKTVLRFIKDGRLRATRIGKAYRILGSDLDAFAGVTAHRRAIAAEARATLILDTPDVDPETAQRLSRFLPAARMGNETHADNMSLDIAYDPARRNLKIVMVGSPGDVAHMLKLIEAWLEG
jgi:excisionase family DNA binding protein